MAPSEKKYSEELFHLFHFYILISSLIQISDDEMELFSLYFLN